MRVAFLGLGLIGGSVARALREAGPAEGWELVAWTPSGDGPRAALEAGVIDSVAGAPDVAIDGADLVVLAGPPLACVGLVERLGGDLGPALAAGATVTDVASTKAALTAAASRAGIPFVGGHPMAGRETSGFDAADAGLFRDRPWVVTEAVGGGDPAVVRRLAEACGARPVTLGAERHDALVAAISHLPLLVSVALVEAVAGAGDASEPDWPDARALAAGGWRDMSRLARGDARMGAEIAATNAASIAGLLRRHRDRIDALLAELEAPDGPDPAGLERRLARAAERAGPEPGAR
jgi:prephenate dehydrogenase